MALEETYSVILFILENTFQNNLDLVFSSSHSSRLCNLGEKLAV